MANEEIRTITIVFKNNQGSADYKIEQTELDRLSKAFDDHGYTNSTGTGTYDVFVVKDGRPRRLMLRFADVLYIG